MDVIFTRKSGATTRTRDLAKRTGSFVEDRKTATADAIRANLRVRVMGRAWSTLG
jgi:hypothetical protein